VHEISAVDDPANMIPGWMLQKRAASLDFAEA